MTPRIDLWEIMFDATPSSIHYSAAKFEVIYRHEKHQIELKDVHEIGLYKMDHMTHDTIMMYFNTDRLVLEIPFEIEIYKGELSENLYLIDQYKWTCRVQNMEGFIEWLANSLNEFEKRWLSCSEPLLDSPSLVINYKIPLTANQKDSI
jgi:hypothetical protein